IDAVTTALPSPPLPPPLYIPPLVNHRDDIPETEMPPRKRLCLSTLGSRYEIGESSTARPTGDRGIAYGDTWVDPAEAVPEIAPMTLGYVNTRVTELAELHEHDTRDLYALLENAQDSRTHISQRAYAAREAWDHSIGLSQAVYSELQSHQEQELIDAVTTALPSPPLPPPLYIPPLVNHRDDIPETEMPPRKRLCLSTLGSRYEIGESSTARPTEDRGIDYGDTWVDPAEVVPEIAPMTLGYVNTRVTKLAELHEHDTQDLYALLENAQDSRTHISQRAYAAREAWAHSIGLSQAVHQLHETRFQMQQAKIAELQETDHRHQAQMVETLRVIGDIRREMGNMQAELLVLREQPRRARQPKENEVLKKKMTNKYCPQGEIKKLEIKLWNLKVKGNDVPAYTERFQELTLICTKFVANETKNIYKYIGGLPDNIYRSVKASKPKMLDETIELANDLMDQKLRTYAERQTNNKRKDDDSFKNNHGHQQQPAKRQKVTKIYNMGSGERKPYGGNLPKCTKCHLHQNGLCTQKCHKCTKVGHFAHDCKSSGNTNVANAQRDNRANPK
nr:hypothetical protein [Tanacetum cinerariifolium]